MSVSLRGALMAFFAIAVFFYFVRIILLPFVIAGTLAFLCTPAVEWLAARLGLQRWIAATAVFVLLLGIASLIGSLAAPVFLRELMPLASDLEGTFETAARGAIGDHTVNILGQTMDATQIGQWAAGALRDTLGQDGGIVWLASWSFIAVFGAFLTFVLLFYFLVSGREVAAGAFWLVPPKHRPLAASIWAQLDPILRRYFIGIGVVGTYAVIAAYIGLGLVLGLRHAGPLALLTGFLEMIPVIGPGSAAVIAGLVALHTATSVWSIVAYAIYATALRLSIDQLFGPLVLGHAAQVHPALIIFCFLAGGLLFGIPGVILAVPLALALRILLATLYAEPMSEAAEADVASN